MNTGLILLGGAAIGAVVLGVRRYNRAVERELAESSPPTAQAAPDETAPMSTFTDLSPDEAKQFLATHEGATLLDVRTPPECAAGIIEGALCIPMQSLQGREAEIAPGPVLVYCAVGARSAAVADYLVKLGRDEVYNLDGGIMAWDEPLVHP